MLGKPELEYDTFFGFLDLAVGGAEEGFVAVAGVGGVGVEGGGAVVEGLHAAFLAHAVAVGDEVRVLLEGAGGGVDAAVLEEDGLGFELDLVDEDLDLFYTFIHFKRSVVRRELKELDPYFTCKTLLAHDTRG